MDLALFNAIHSFVGITGITDWLGVLIAQYLPYAMGVAAVVFIAKRPTLREKLWTFFYMALTVILSRGTITEIIRFIWNRPRPFLVLGFTPLISESSASFPSGHMTFFFAIAFVLFMFDKKWGTWFFVLSSIVGVARVFAGVHWPSDIVGGVIVAYISFLIVKFALKQFEPKPEPVIQNPA